MRMRLSIALLAAVAAALPTAASAQSLAGTIVVRVDFRNTPGEGRALQALERQLTEFRNQVRVADRGQAPTFGPFRVEDVSGLERNPINAWKTDTVAMMWGSAMATSATLYRPEATLFIGPLRVRPMLPQPANSFRSLQGMVAITGTRDTDLGTFANYIGYAILLRIWAEQPLRAATIASVLERRIQGDYGGPNASSACLDDLLQAVKLIQRRASRGRFPEPGNLSGLQYVDCS
jgi:hypothetical protein